MLPPGTRYTSTTPVSLAEGWSLERLTPPSRLFGANGLRTGPDGRIYVAQVAGSQISALNVDTGELETVSAQGADIVAPDDVDFDGLWGSGTRLSVLTWASMQLARTR